MGEQSRRATRLTPHERRTRERMITAALFLLIVGTALFILSTLVRFGLLNILLLLFFGLLLAVLLRAFAKWVKARTDLPDGWALAIVIATLVLLIGLFFWLVAPRIGDQVGDLAQRLPEAVRQLRDLVAQRFPWVRPFLDDRTVSEMADVPTLLGRLTGFASQTFGIVVNVVVVIFIGIYLAASPRENLEGVVFLFPRSKRRRAREVLLEAGETLRLWMIGQLVPMAAIAVMTSVGLWLLGVELAFTIGIIAGLFNFIPNFGPLFALVPAVLVAIGDGPEKVLWVVLLFMVAQSIEGYIIMPLVQQRMVQLPPALTITMQVVLGLVVGAIGVALAAPLTAAILVIVKMLYVEDVLHEETELPSEQAERRKEEREEEKAAKKEDGG
jgi:predicted PurR-regulated permease PerM